MMKWKISPRSLVLAAICTLLPAVALTDTQLDPGLKGFQKSTGIAGNLNSIGSDTMNNLMTLWAEGFRQNHPSVRIQVEGKGSSTAPPALIEGTAQLAPMSRPMKSTEIDAFEKKFGYKPTEIKTSLDALAIYVHKDNPLTCISLPEADAAFSSTRKGGFATDITTWDQLGLSAWKAKPISLYGRNSASGTYGYFKDHVLSKGDFKSTVKEQPGSAAVVQGVTADPYGMGYSGIGYVTSGVKALGISKEKGGTCVAADQAHVLDGTYALSRFLYVYVNRKPGQPMDALTAEFLRFALSKEGQAVVLKDGYLPLPASVADKELAKLK